MGLDIHEIKKCNTKYLGREIIYYKEIQSTQTMLKEMAGSVPNGTVLMTDNQTNGIGTHDRTWYSNIEKNITMSFVLYPKCNISSLEFFTRDIAKCMIQTIKELYDYELELKLPNDIKLDRKKIGGILTQSSISGEKINYLVIGIGFNVNEEYFCDQINGIATSLKDVYQEAFKREEIIKKFFEIFEQYLLENSIL